MRTSRSIAVINLAIIVAAVALGVVSVKKYLLTPTVQAPTKLRPPAPNVVGQTISIPEVDWSRSRKTMVVALDRGCPFCTSSAPFYKRLVAKAAGNQNVQVIAVLPHDPSTAQQYLDSIDVNFDNVKSSELSRIAVSATPTLLLLDDQGVITAFWVGALSVNQETEVLRRIAEIASN